MNHKDVIAALELKAQPDRAPLVARFFKAGPGEYAEGDRFLGITVPAQREIAKQFRGLPLTEIEKLLQSSIHEHRLTSLFILVDAYKKADEAGKIKIAQFYLAHTAWINNWDLVDSSAGYILGPQLDNLEPGLLEKLAKSKSLWERRIAMISTFYGIQRGDPIRALTVAELLLHDTHDLIQKAVGWMLREIGKRCDRAILVSFLTVDNRYKTMPRTMLRYAIEHFPEVERKKYLAGAV